LAEFVFAGSTAVLYGVLARLRHVPGGAVFSGGMQKRPADVRVRAINRFLHGGMSNVQPDDNPETDVAALYGGLPGKGPRHL
jgi:hypothetical protein